MDIINFNNDNDDWGTLIWDCNTLISFVLLIH